MQTLDRSLKILFDIEPVRYLKKVGAPWSREQQQRGRRRREGLSEMKMDVLFDFALMGTLNMNISKMEIFLPPLVSAASHVRTSALRLRPAGGRRAGLQARRLHSSPGQLGPQLVERRLPRPDGHVPAQLRHACQPEHVKQPAAFSRNHFRHHCFLISSPPPPAPVRPPPTTHPPSPQKQQTTEREHEHCCSRRHFAGDSWAKSTLIGAENVPAPRGTPGGGCVWGQS